MDGRVLQFWLPAARKNLCSVRATLRDVAHVCSPAVRSRPFRGVLERSGESCRIRDDNFLVVSKFDEPLLLVTVQQTAHHLATGSDHGNQVLHANFSAY